MNGLFWESFAGFNSALNKFEGRIIVSLAFISILGQLVLVLLIHFNEELQVHPLQLIKYITCVDAFIAVCFINSYFVCEVGLPWLYAWTVYGTTTPEALYASILTLELSINVLCLYAIFLMFLLNTFLAVDLILMLKHPFAIKEKRMQIYLIVSFVVAAVPTICGYKTLNRAS